MPKVAKPRLNQIIMVISNARAGAVSFVPFNRSNSKYVDVAKVDIGSVCQYPLKSDDDTDNQVG